MITLKNQNGTHYAAFDYYEFLVQLSAATEWLVSNSATRTLIRTYIFWTANKNSSANTHFLLSKPLTHLRGTPETSFRNTGLAYSVKDSSTLSLTSALDGGGWLTPRHGCFTPEKENWCPLYTRLVVSRVVWTGAENLFPPGFDTRTVRPVASRYTDWAIAAHLRYNKTGFLT